jgi:uncharacterized membrane protein YeaQ/YmgE (transglycosylase-associated protein family)
VTVTVWGIEAPGNYEAPQEPPEKEGIVTVTGIISAIIVGLVIGALGRLVVPGRQSIPIWLTMLIGIGAALLGTVFARAIGVADTSGFDWTEFFIQVVLAAIGVALTVGLTGRRRTIT